MAHVAINGLVLGAVLSGCGDPAVVGDDAAVVSDGATEDSSSDTPCDPLAVFSAPAKIMELAYPGRDTVPRLTADELTLVYSRQASTFPADFDYDLYIATRSSRSDPFGAPVAITQVNSIETEANHSISSDGLSLYFDSSRVGGSLYVATRTAITGEFGSSTPLVALNTASVDSSPFITSDGSELWFASDGFDLLRARWTGAEFGDVTRQDSLNSASYDGLPVLTANDRTVYLASSRPGGWVSWISGARIDRQRQRRSLRRCWYRI